ncbi:hypothetical protein N0V93_000275 [Gnomoniopsis smithogilvyi]|uniref:N-acetyltransferase domain-containing protein n=1 Tax=Gnomoniopsis smithogilvyi TaxID=1191159 RepID=A0A9W8Z1H3_9PEZI|nr:hypothetical protein N0V93_000275 [Gnomoniopsis smithogilvyi]
MNPSAFPPHPDFGSEWRLRPATELDQPVLVGLENRASSQLFQYISPHSKLFIEDYARYFMELTMFNLRDPRTVVIVAESTTPWIPRGPANVANEATAHEVSLRFNVVGTAVWRLPKNSVRSGQFVVRDVSATVLPRVPPHHRDRDVDPLRQLLCSALMHAGCEEHRFQDKLCLDALIVHQDYRNGRYGKALLDWGKKLAIQDRVGMGLLCSEGVLPYFRKHCFKTVRDFRVPSDGPDRGFTYKWCVLEEGTASREQSTDTHESEEDKVLTAGEQSQHKNIPIEWDV